jgi:hypothetical protein
MSISHIKTPNPTQLQSNKQIIDLKIIHKIFFQFIILMKNGKI